MSVLEILSSAKQVILSDLVSIKLVRTESHIIRKNENIIHCAKYQGLKGLFRKDVEETRVFGRRVCDTVRERMMNQGFFTTDELPSYGLSGGDKEMIFQGAGADTQDDLVVIFAYGLEEARKTKTLFEALLREAKYSWLY